MPTLLSLLAMLVAATSARIIMNDVHEDQQNREHRGPTHTLNHAADLN